MNRRLFLVLALAAIASDAPSAEAREYKWPFRITGVLPRSDIAKIVDVVRRQERFPQYRILEIRVKSPIEVEVSSGHIVGPDNGSGYILILRKQHARWDIYDNGTFTTWVL